jgi:hypothetical protein
MAAGRKSAAMRAIGEVADSYLDVRHSDAGSSWALANVLVANIPNSPTMSPQNAHIRDFIAGLRCDLIVPLRFGDYFEYSGPVPAGKQDQRRFPRYYFRTKAGVCFLPLKGTRYDQFQRATYIKDLSRSGLAFLHDEPLDAGEIVNFLLPNGTIRGVSVMRCKRVSLRCYEIAGDFVKQPLSEQSVEEIRRQPDDVTSSTDA